MDIKETIKREIVEKIPFDPGIYMMKDEDPDTWSASDRFRIQEGSWGDYYAARVELWYKPESSDEEKLLHSVIYKVEGWSR